MPGPESNLELRFVAEVRRRGGLTEKLAPTRKGLPDRFVILPGGEVRLVELKAPGGVLSPAQRVWHGKAARVGHGVATLTGPSEIAEWLDTHM